MTANPLAPWIAEKIGIPFSELSPEAIKAYQFNQIRKTIAYVKEKSLFYREKLQGVDPVEIVDHEQFSRLPFTDPQDITVHPQRFVCTGQREIARIVTLHSSGTTGPAKRIYFTREDQELTIDFFHHGMKNCVGPADRVLILLPGETPGSVGDLLRIGLERMDVYPVPYGVVSDPEDAIAVALDQQVNSLVGIPVQVLSMARHQKGEALRGRLKSILLSTDYVPQSLCRVLEEKWDCQVYQHYGMTEMGLGGGVQCMARRGYHLREADLFFEIVDPVTGQPVEEGNWGEVVFTTLTRTGMPLIRYRTGDLSRFIKGDCPCGTILKSMATVKGRIEERIKLEEHYLSLPELDEVLFSIENIIDYRVQLGQTKGKDVLEIDLKTNGEKIVASAEIIRALRTIPAIGAALTDKLEVRVSSNAQFSPSTAKRRIIDNRPASPLRN